MNSNYLIQTGYSLLIGMLIFSLGGYYIDQKKGSGYAWTLGGLFIGLLFGTYEIWKMIKTQNEKDINNESDS